MLKEQNRIYWYLAGIVVGIVLLLLFARDVALPFIAGQQTSLDPGEYFYQEPPPTVINQKNDYYMELQTNYGNIRVDLFEDRAPNNVNSVVFLANQGFYNGTKFHRLVPGLLIQGGDRNTLNDEPADDGFGNPGYFISDEVNWDSLDLSEKRRQELRSAGYQTVESLDSVPLQKYVVAMANTRPNSNAAQFFIVLANSDDPRVTALQGRFTVVGRVTDGARVMNTIANIPVDNPESQVPRPTKDVVLQQVRIYTN